MTQEDKELLLKDICARLPYETLLQDIEYNLRPVHGGIIDIWHKEIKLFGDEPYRPIECIRPYLRSMSSMTEAECETLGNISATLDNKLAEILPNTPYYIEVAVPDQIDWLNAHHFDYRGLIPKGLALEAKEGMYE